VGGFHVERRGFLAAVAAAVAGPKVAAALRPKTDFESYLDFIRPATCRGWDFGREPSLTVHLDWVRVRPAVWVPRYVRTIERLKGDEA
jgi:hypothetical protein